MYKLLAPPALFAMLLFAVVNATPLLAEKKLPNLEGGQSYADVLKKWGAPLSKDEFETARKEIWWYEDAKVEFREGVVRSWKIGIKDKIDLAAAQRAKSAEALTQTQNDSVDVEGLLSEIMQEPGDASEVKMPGALPAPVEMQQ